VLERTLFVKFEEMLTNRDMVMVQMREHLGLPVLNMKKLSDSHETMVFSNYVGNSLNMDRCYRSLANCPEETRQLILDTNNDIADVFYTQEESQRIVGHREAA
jgi:hypothetical protein